MKGYTIQLRRWGIIGFMILMFTACTPDQEASDAADSLPAMTKPEEEESIKDGQTLTVVTPETAKNPPETKNKYQIQTRLTDFHMLDEATGVAWGLNGTALRLYITDDYGETWVDISPSSNVKFMDKLVYGTDLVFTDERHGYIVRNGQGQRDTMIMTTVDGGREWRFSSLPNTGRVTALSFDSDQGWVMTAPKSILGIQEKILYRLVPQDTAWTEIMQNRNYPASRVPDFVLPRSGFVTGMSYANAYTGLVSVKERRGGALYITRDGGETWSPVDRVFSEEPLTECETFYPGSAVFLGNAQKVWVPLQCFMEEQLHDLGYFSEDGGKSWELIEFPLVRKSSTRNAAPFFYRMNQGYAIMDGIVYVTEDKGQTWEPFEEDEVLAQNLDNYPIISKLQFASSEVGWMLVETLDGSRSRLLLSLDGGKSWKVR
ncbi:YCF48-related protein [Paenibacillus sp. JSM ZJ436]|uniref:sialidase family protein n=1 Tax=Paenibacillus sp. JSM ZJ436 TaxID=3376190 RepID=UPI0037BB0E40